MLMSVLLGLGLTLFFLAQGELLMENNGSVRAQVLSNTIRFGTTVIGLSLAMVIVAGTLFASLMNGPSQTIHFEEE
jgi:formate/nitrite transporter FocA (FNT family)